MNPLSCLAAPGTPLPQTPAWFSGPPMVFRELYALRDRIHRREARVARYLRHLSVAALGVLLSALLVSQYAVAAAAPAPRPASIVLVALLPVLCALTIFAVHVLEMRFADMGDDGCYAHTLQTHLYQVHLEMLPQDPDPVEKLILQDARQWLSALAQQRPIRPALIGAGLRLGR